ncbi:hypothetical protein TNCV_3332811 [Trichonephila clavipes]|nr:hypothetical protein TNCV_3332811 [Trichonephila clavipes]
MDWRLPAGVGVKVASLGEKGVVFVIKQTEGECCWIASEVVTKKRKSLVWGGADSFLDGKGKEFRRTEPQSVQQTFTTPIKKAIENKLLTRIWMSEQLGYLGPVASIASDVWLLSPNSSTLH